MERINGSEWVWNIVNTYDSEVRNISDRLSFEKMLLWVNTRGMVMNKEIRSDKRIKNIIGIIQSCLILILIFLIVFMIIQINRLQGTARVINYAGLVRGATQREVKLEITGNQKDELIKYLDNILSGLRYQEGQYDLVKIHDKEYQDKLRIQSEYWEKLKTEIGEVRSKGYQNTDIVNMSEIYFEMADETVFAAENYSEKIAIKIRTIEFLSALDMFCLVILIIMQTLTAMKMAMNNKLLEQKAYTDAHTGLPNKDACELLLNTPEKVKESTACMMFDLNNLKIVNDTMGHEAGDRLILNACGCLTDVFGVDAVFRIGGDEFLVICKQIDENTLIKRITELKELMNERSVNMASGVIWSENVITGFNEMLREAEEKMYADKARYYKEKGIERRKERA